MSFTLTVLRFDPADARGPYWQDYAVEVPSTASVLDALLAAAEEKDPSLAFRRMCRSGICGACGMRVNGRLVLACQLSVADAAGARPGDRIEVGPLPNFRVLKDLVVDLDPFFDGLRAALPWLVANPAYDGLIPPAVSQAMERPASCVLCGICEADQPREPGQAGGAAAWVKAYRFALDPRDALGRTRLKVMADLGLVGAGAVAQLARVCPKSIFLAGALEPGGPTILEDGDERRLAGEE